METNCFFAKAERLWIRKNIKLVEYIPCCALKAEIWLRTEILGGVVSRRKEQIFENICTFKKHKWYNRRKASKVRKDIFNE